MKSLARVVTGAALLASVTGVAQAQLGVTYSTRACFDYLGHACPPNPYTTNASSSGGSLNFAGVTNVSSTIPTSGGTVSLGTLGISGYDDGILSILPINDYNDGSYTGTTFKLFVDFTAPTGAGSTVYTAALNGSLSRADDGQGVFVTFGGPQQIDYTGGSMFLAVNNPAEYYCNYNRQNPLFVVGTCTGLETQNLTGTLTYSVAPPPITTTPEPSSMALLGTGLVGLVPMFRRRK